MEYVALLGTGAIVMDVGFAPVVTFITKRLVAPGATALPSW